MWKNMVEPDRPQMIVWRMLFLCWIAKATNEHLEYVICFAFPLQEWLHKPTPVLRYTYIACLVMHNVCVCTYIFMHEYVICVHYCCFCTLSLADLVNTERDNAQCIMFVCVHIYSCVNTLFVCTIVAFVRGH
jgi:hypothetical protein